MKALFAISLATLVAFTAGCLEPAPVAGEGESCDPNNIPCSTGLECVRGFCIPEETTEVDAGETLSDAGTSDSDSGADSTNVPCDGTCSDEQVCDTTTQTCVACLEDGDCADGICTDDNVCVGCEQNGDCSTGICDPDSNECVECLLDDDCDDGVCSDGRCVQCLESADCDLADASECDTATNTCVPCSEPSHCSHLAGAGNGVCSIPDDVCVECVDTDDGRQACAGNSCDPATNECTSTPIATLDVCQTCVSTSECGEGLTCARTTFDGQPRDVFHCVLLDTGGCLDRVFVVSQTAATPDGSMVDICGPPPLTTCEGYLDLSANTSCTDGLDCGTTMTDGVCNDNGRCTYPCSRLSHCALGDTCADLASGSGFCAPQ